MVPIDMAPSRSGETRERILVSTDLFAWRSAAIVLLVERRNGAWIVARGWRAFDELRHVRRWRFQSPTAAIGQVRRLVREAAGDHAAAGEAAQRWLDLVTSDGDVVASEREID